ncbi:ATP-grasp domain-containing protein [Halomonas sp. KM-1]|uniref:ATP-grasp domain-containing protein n=1 Tax=Halomonas sp. KM-1 TaxID=590061 RepID=UPI001930B02C|nr:ATP-grasp domain-containing protein [Halomonas sp. KM-1]
MNVLLSCVGRRNYLVEYFREALQERGRVVAVNSEAFTSGMVAAERSYIVPPIHSDAYIDELLKICRMERIGLLLSLFDIDLPVISAARQRFADLGIVVAVSEPWVVEMANDKWHTSRFLAKNAINGPRTYLGLDMALVALRRGEVDFPLMVKPRWGMGSLSIHRADDQQSLCFFHHLTSKQIAESYLNVLSGHDPSRSIIIQEMIKGEEYGVDVFNDLEGEHLATVVKRKLAMRAGETDSAETVSHTEVAGVAEQLGKLLRHRANLDVDIMLSHDGGSPCVLEFNARFGGGYPFTHLAGANFPRALISLAEGRAPDAACLTAKFGIRGVKSLVPLVCRATPVNGVAL